MCLIFVVHNVLQVNTSSFFEVLKKLLIKDECYATDLFHSGLLFCISVHKIDSNPDGKFTAEFFTFEAF